MNNNDELLTTAEVAKILKLKVTTVQKLIREEKIKAIYLGCKSPRVKRGEIEKIINEGIRE